jgi:hypothetical protein
MNFKQLVKRLAPFIYFLAVSLPHHPFSAFFEKEILIPKGMDAVQSDVNIVSVAILLGVIFLGIRLVRIQRREELKHLAAWLVLVVLMFVSDRYLIVNNIERIHFPQYAVLALLLGFSLRSEALIFFATSSLGFLDEFLQYAMNPNRTNYLDFNDIVLNILGAAFGVALLLGFRKAVSSERSPYERAFRLFFLGGLSVASLAVVYALVSGRVVMLINHVGERSVFSDLNGRLSFIISFERHSRFWQQSDYGKVFHVFSPIEGVMAIALSSALGSLMIRWLERSQREASAVEAQPLSEPDSSVDT